VQNDRQNPERAVPRLWSRNEGMIDNLVTLATCGGILAVAVRAILIERREAGQDTTARPRRTRR
jgi:hypothetical protein